MPTTKPTRPSGEPHRIIENDCASSESDDSLNQLLTDGLPRSVKLPLANAKLTEDSQGQNTPESEEDYDLLKPSRLTVVPGGKGGGFDEDNAVGNSDDEEEVKVFESIAAEPSVNRPHRPSNLRLKSIPIVEKRGQYYILADDVEIKKILKRGVEREKDKTPLKRRKKFSDLVFTRQFTAFDRQNAESARSPFHGFFTLFWLGTAIFVVQIAAKNWQEHGNLLGTNEIMRVSMNRDLLVLAISDGVLCGSTGFGWILQRLILAGHISWNSVGWIIQTSWQIFYVFAFLSWTLYREWPWTHTVFFVLHGIIMLMKQHSYAFYNGYLSESYKSRSSLRRKLNQLRKVSPVQTPSATTPAARALNTGYLEERPAAVEMNQRRRYSFSAHNLESTSEISQVAEAIESGAPLDADQIVVFERMINWEIDALSEDLKGKASEVEKSYPHNLTFTKHYEYIVLPTLVYELEYPRSEQINWYYVMEKATATFGVLFIMMLVSQAFIYPVVVHTVAMKESGVPLIKRLEAFPWILSDLLFPFMMEYMMAWYIIWECILNLLAELTYFADRGFYADWWNSESWDSFARDWNRPVHNFLLRHVYHSTISSFSVNKDTATLITFFLSACVHELVMWCLFKKLRGYLLVLQMSQLPLVQLSRSRWLKGRGTLGNLIFWIGIFTGPSLLCSLYLIL